MTTIKAPPDAAIKTAASSPARGGGPPTGSSKIDKMPVTWASLGLMAVTGAGLAYYYQGEKEKKQQQALGKVTSYGKPALGGPWTLVDFTGKPVTDADFRGEFLLLYFGFTHCPDICPSELVKVGRILDLLDKEPRLPMVRPVFISVDPDRDNVGQLRHYAQDFHPRILYLTGTQEQLAKVTKGYRVYFSKADEEDEENYLVDHSIVLYLIGPDGSFLDFFTQSMQPTDIVNRIKGYLGQARRVDT
ncbi:sco1 family protein [Nannochloropsis oceanica]